MIIRGFFHSAHKCFYVLAKIYIRNIPYYVNLMVDSGSSVTALLDRDALRIFGKRLEKLKKARKDLVGIGGFADTYYIENVKIELVDSLKPEITYTTVLKRLYIVTHHKHFRGEEWKRVSQMPSILGRDVLLKSKKIVFYMEEKPPLVEIEFP